MEKMTEADKQIEYIQQYLDGDLTLESQKAFEEKIAEDAELKEHVESIRYLLDGFRTAEADQVREMVQGWEAERKESKKPAFSLRNWYIAAAAVALILILPLGYRWLNTPPTAAEFYKLHYTAYQSDLSMRGQSEEKQLFQQAMAAYSKANYGDAIQVFQICLTQDSLWTDQQKANIYLCLSSAYLETDQADSAIATLQKMPSDTMYQEHLDWYQALAYLKKGEIEQAKKHLQAIAEAPFYRERVANILSQLD